MNCPRCGRPVGENANFCGGCGLPKADIIKYLKRQEEAINATQTDINSEIKPDIDLEETEIPLSDDINNTCELDYTTQTEDNTTFSAVEDGSSFEESENASQPEYQFMPQAENYNRVVYDASLNEDTAPLTTADYLWMLIFSGIPFVGLFYLIYTAIQGDNQNKRSFARATLIFGIYGIVLAVVFVIGALVAFR